MKSIEHSIRLIRLQIINMLSCLQISTNLRNPVGKLLEGKFRVNQLKVTLSYVRDE